MAPESFSLADLFKQAGSNDPENCPTGEADVEVISAQAVTAKSGAPMIKVKFRITSGPYAGRTVYDNIVLTVDNPDSHPYFFAKLSALNANDPELFRQCQGTLSPIAKTLPGRRTRVDLEARTWNGATKPQVKSYVPITDDSSSIIPDTHVDDIPDDPFGTDEEPF